MKIRLIYLLLTLPIMFRAGAQTLTIDECVSLARENYPAIARYGLIEKTTQYSLSNASKAWLPQGMVSGQLTWQNDVAAWPEQFANMLAQQGMNFPGIDKTQYKVGVDVSQQIWDGGRTAASKRSIESASEVEKRTLDVQLYDVEGRVQDIYFAILLFDGRITSTKKSIELVDSTLRQMQSMFRNGVAMQSDCDQIEAGLLTLGQQKVQLMTARDGYQRILEIFIGQSIDGRELILPDVPLGTSKNSAQLQLFDAQLRHITTQERSIQASVMPQVGAFASGYYGYPGFNMFKNMQSHDPSFNFMLGVKVSWNFGSLYTRSNALNKIELQRQQIEANRKTFLFNNSMSETETASHIASLKEVMHNDARIVELRRAVVRAAQSQLRNGVIDATTLLTKITDAELAENNFILHNIELTKAIYNLNHIKNK